MKKYRTILISILMAAMFSACAEKKEEEPVQPTLAAQEAQEPEDYEMPGKDLRGEPFEGLWSCGEYSIRVGAEDIGYKVEVQRRQDDTTEYSWMYSCLFEEQSNSLTDPGNGYKNLQKYDEKGELLSDTTIREKMGARFTLDEEGFLIWDNYEEEFGEGLKFERMSASAYYMWEDTDEATLRAVFEKGLFTVPEGAVVSDRRILKNNYPEEDLSALAEMVFVLDGRDYVARMQQGKDVDWDISGVYSFRAVKEDVTLKEWGNCPAECYNTVDEDTAFMLLIWHDESTGTAYSLYYCNPGGTLEGVDLVEVANGMCPE